VSVLIDLLKICVFKFQTTLKVFLNYSNLYYGPLFVQTHCAVQYSVRIFTVAQK